MKKHVAMGAVLALSITVGAMLPGLVGAVFADNLSNSASNNAVETTISTKEAMVDNTVIGNRFIDVGSAKDDFSQKEYIQKLLKAEVITQAEADKLIDAEDKIKELSEQIDTLYSDANSIYERANEAMYYKQFIDNNVLTADEIEQLKLAEKQLSALYENITEFSEDELEDITKQEKAIREKYAQIYEKVDNYFKEKVAKETEAYYQSLVEDGKLTTAEVERLKEAEQKIHALYDNLDVNSTDEVWKETFQKIDTIYEGLDFLDKINYFYSAPEAAR